MPGGVPVAGGGQRMPPWGGCVAVAAGPAAFPAGGQAATSPCAARALAVGELPAGPSVSFCGKGVRKPQGLSVTCAWKCFPYLMLSPNRIWLVDTG